MIGYDTTSPSFWCPDDAEFAICYGDGLYENVLACHARFPHLVKKGRIIDLTVRGAIWKDPFSGSDIEPGNAGPGTAVPYVVGERRAGVRRPPLYASQSDMRQILQNLANAGIHIGPPGPNRPVRLCIAHPTGHEHLCGPKTCGFPVDADITQFWWTEIQGRGNWRGFPGNIDVSVARADAFGVPKPINPYLIFPSSPGLRFRVNGTVVRWSEAGVMVRVDGALKHSARYHSFLKSQLRPVVKFCRDRVWMIAHYHGPDFTRPRARVDWEAYSRGTRWQLINHRLQKIDAL